MAHTCPNCGSLCHCNGDIGDLCFGERWDCDHCDVDDYDPDDEFLDDLEAHDPLAERGILQPPHDMEDDGDERNDPNDSRNL